jgi:hypothetical protein
MDEPESRYLKDAGRVEAAWQTGVVAQREHAPRVLALQLGERVVDLGCGPALPAQQVRVCVEGSARMAPRSATKQIAATSRSMSVELIALLPQPDRRPAPSPHGGCP